MKYEATCKGSDVEVKESLATRIQAVLICFEMFGAALVHRTVFSYRDYRLRVTDEKEMGFGETVIHSFNPRIVVQQVTSFTGAGKLKGGVDAAGGLINNAVEAASDRCHGSDRMLR